MNESACDLVHPRTGESTQDVHNQKTSVGRFVSTYMSMFFVGGLSGVAIDWAFTGLYMALSDCAEREWLRLGVASLQMLSCGFVLYGFERASSRWAREFQTTLPGLAFPAIIFGLQSELFSAIHGVAPYPSCRSASPPEPTVAE